MDTLVKLQAEEDETAYLMNDPQHKSELLEAIEAIAKGNLKTYKTDEIKAMVVEG